MLTQNNRVPIIARSRTMIGDQVQHILRRYWTYSKDDILFLKAQTRLNIELDVKQVIRSMNFLKAAVKLFTTKRERKLIRIQSNRTTITVNSQDEKVFNQKTPNKMSLLELQQIHEDSSGFDTDQQTKYLEKLSAKLPREAFKLNKTERKLLKHTVKCVDQLNFTKESNITPQDVFDSEADVVDSKLDRRPSLDRRGSEKRNGRNSRSMDFTQSHLDVTPSEVNN